MMTTTSSKFKGMAELEAVYNAYMRHGIDAAPLEALEQQYPEAYAYLKARDYSRASHQLQANAGQKAMTLLNNGGTAQDAMSILDNWLPEDALWADFNT